MTSRRFGVVLFITDAEERGLSGARMFTLAPPGGLRPEQMVINLNFDMLAHPNVVRLFNELNRSLLPHHVVVVRLLIYLYMLS
jgi:Zn-dependent M28 family amino/carboxypeptidase